MRKLIFILVISSFMFSCEHNNIPLTDDNIDITSAFVLNKAIILAAGDCAGDQQSDTYICFDSAFNDSRCPQGVQCIWEGNAQARFKFVKSNELPIFFVLDTHSGFTTDTIVGGYKFTLKTLTPYPIYGKIILPKDYKAEIEIEKVAI